MSMGPFSTTNVYCDMANSGGWIVIQRNRVNSQLSFDKNWREYEEGFGDLKSDFWAGLELMHTLTQRGQWEMRIDFQKKQDKTWGYLHYTQFSVGSASDEYPLTVGGYTGTISSSLALYFNGMKFTTLDNDNDERGDNCAVSYKSGNWYKDCHTINVNQQPPYINPFYTAIIFAEMKIRPKDCIMQ